MFLKRTLQSSALVAYESTTVDEYSSESERSMTGIESDVSTLFPISWTEREALLQLPIATYSLLQSQVSLQIAT